MRFLKGMLPHRSRTASWFRTTVRSRVLGLGVARSMSLGLVSLATLETWWVGGPISGVMGRLGPPPKPPVYGQCDGCGGVWPAGAEVRVLGPDGELANDSGS